MARHAAFEILYREYYPRVFGLCRRLLNSQDAAEDAVQEVFIRAYKSFGKYDPDQPFWHWIAAVTNNYCIDVLRQRSRGEALFGDEEAELASLEGGAPTPIASLIADQDARAVSDAISALPDKYRVPLVLAYLNQSSYDEIAEQLDISRNHVGVLLLRAQERLRIQIGEVAA